MTQDSDDAYAAFMRSAERIGRLLTRDNVAAFFADELPVGAVPSDFWLGVAVAAERLSAEMTVNGVWLTLDEFDLPEMPRLVSYETMLKDYMSERDAKQLAQRLRNLADLIEQRQKLK